MCRGMTVISTTRLSPALTARTNFGYGNAKAFPDLQNLLTSLFTDHPGKQWAGSHQMIGSRQHLKNKSPQLS